MSSYCSEKLEDRIKRERKRLEKAENLLAAIDEWSGGNLYTIIDHQAERFYMHVLARQQTVTNNLAKLVRQAEVEARLEAEEANEQE